MKPTLPTCLTRQMTTRLVLFTLLFLGLGQTRGFAQELFRYTNLTSGVGTVATNTAPASLIRGNPDIDPASDCMANQGFGSHGWPTTNTFNVNTFNSSGWYVEFTLDPDPGYGLKVTGMTSRSRRENPAGTANDGPISIRYGYSTDGGANWTAVYPGNPQSSNLCASGGVNRVWPAWDDTLTSNPIIFRIYALSSGSARDGDLFLRDIVVNGVVCANTPTITPAPGFVEVCYGTTSVDYEYTSDEADTYSIDYDDISFVDVPAGTSLPAGPNSIALNIPANTPAGSYTGTLTVANSCGFSTDYGFTIEVHALPDVTIAVSPAIICAGDDVTLTFTDNAATGHLFTIVADLMDDNGTSVGEINFSGIPSGAFVVYTEGVDFDGDVYGAVSLTNIVVTDETTECVNDTLSDRTVEVNPLPVAEITATDSSGVANDMAICTGGAATLTASGGVGYIWSTGATTAAISVSPVSTSIYTVTVTSADDCTATVSKTVTVNPYPSASLSVVPAGSICPGTTIEIFFNESAWIGGTEFTIGADVSPLVFGFDTLTLYEVISGDHVDLIEGIDFTGDLSVTQVWVTEPISGCSSAAYSVMVDVLDAPEFEFSATSEGDGPYSGNNGAGPNTLDVDFCAGQHLTLSGYDDNGNVGYTSYYTTTGNVTYDGGALPLSSGPSNTAFGSAATFFGSVYGGVLGYGLTTGTSGTINQIFVPYLDNDGSGTFTAGDCEGDTMFLNYHIYAVPTVTVTPPTTAVCNGGAVNIAFSGNYGAGATYTWANGNITIGLAANGTGNISFTAVNNGNTNLVANLTVTPSANGCDGTPVNFTITVYPEPVVTNITATVSGGDPQSANNTGGPNAIVLDFCAGESFAYSLYNATAGIGFLEEIVAGTTNLLYGITPIPVPRPQTNISFGSAPGFFGGTYGPYNLASGTYGWMTETFTPYFDGNGDGDYDPLTDCLGEPISVTYRVYAPISLSITRNNPAEICSGALVDYTFSTTSTELISFDLVLEENTNAGNPADLDDDNTLPDTLVGVVINMANPYPFTQAINNAVGTFDRGRVRARAINIAYVDADVCTTANVNGQNTQVYPMPRLEEIDPLLSCNGSTLELDIALLGLPSSNSGAAGYPVRIDWTLNAPDLDENGAVGSIVIYDNAGLELNAGIDIAQLLTLTNPLGGPQTATFTITPRASGPSNPFNADDCFGDPITVEVTVVPAGVPAISGPTCVHEGAEIQLTADNDVDSPATFLSGIWSSTPNVILLDTFDQDTVLVTGYTSGTATITYTVTDDAGCVSVAEYEVEVLEPLLLEHVYTGGPVACGEEFTVTVEVSNFCDINSLDYPFTWDASAFQLVTFDMPTQPAGGTFFSFSSGPGDLHLGFADDGNLPYGNNLTDGTVVFTYTLRAVGSMGSYNLPNVLPSSEAYNSGFQLVPDNTTGVSIPIELLSLDLLGNPVICPSEPFIHLEFDNVVGNPNYYVIDFDPLSSPPFPNIQQGTLVVLDGEIIIPTPPGIQNGSYNATLVVSNTTYGCESAVYLFSIIVDQVDPTASNPAPVNVACLLQIPAPNPAVVIDEADNCPGPITVAYVPGLSTETGTGCAGNPKIINRVYSVTDKAGNTIYVTQTITAVDNLPPTVSNTGLATWYPSGAAAIAAAKARANATKMDNCSSAMGINVAVGVVDTAGCISTIQLIVTDACGNLTPLSNALYTVTIDRQNPVATAGIIDDCYDESEDEQNPYYPYEFAVNAALLATSATDDCDALVDLTAVIDTGSTDCNLTILVIATDDCGKKDTVTYHTRAENDAPIITSNPLALDGECFDTEEEALDAAIAATIAGDDCGNMLQYDAFANGGCPAEIMVVVTDFCGNPATITYTGVHIDTEDPEVDPDPVYATCFKTLAEAYDSLAKAANPFDNCTEAAELLASATGDTTEVGDLNDDCVEVNIEITYTDNCGNEFTHTFEFITIDNTAPTVEPLGDMDVECIDDVDLPNILLVEADDNCEVADIVWLEDEENLPTSCPGTGTRTYRVYDCAGNFTDVIQTININDDQVPVWVNPVGDLDRIIDCEDFSSIDDALMLEPEGLDVNCGDVEVELVSSTESNACAGGFVRTWSVTDLCGNAGTALFVQTITITDYVAPTWVTTASELDSEVSCNDPLGLADSLDVQPVAEDVCGNVTYQMVARYFEFYPVCTGGYLGYWVTEWTAMDDCENTSTSFFHYVYVYDRSDPEWVTEEGAPYPTGLDVTISCSDTAGYTFANTLEPLASDSCDFELDLTKTTGIFVPGGDCPGEGSFMNTWTAIDDCGNVSVMFTQTITLVDNTPPTFDPLCQFMPLNLFTSEAADCHEGISLLVGDSLDYLDTWTVAGTLIPSLGGCIGDNCSPIEFIIVEVVSITDVPGQTVVVNNEFTAECVRQITVSFQLSDACGNVQPTLFVCIYNIIDDTAPVVFCHSDVQSPIAGCYPTVAAAEAAVLADINPCDNCTDVGDLEIEITTVGTCNAEISVVIKDCAGNVSDTIWYQTRIDNTPPVMTVSAIQSCYETVGMAQAAAIAGTTITDNCSPYSELVITVTTAGICPATVTVTATDSCGNSRSVAYPGLCIGLASEVVIAPEASNLTVDCDTWQDDLAAWLADHGGAEATGTIVWSYLPLDPATMLQNSMANCTTHSKSVVVTFRATNDCSNFDETTATFSVTDLVPPTANLIPNTNLTCSTGIPAPNVAIVTGESDNCGGTPTVAVFATSDNLATGCTATPRIIVHQYVVTDAYCNTALINHMITVVDNVPPSFTAPANITINVNAACVYNASSAVTGDVLNESDNCTASGPLLQAYYTDVVNSGVNFQEKYIITRTWHLTDACGNPAIPRVQTITVKDVTPPTLTCPPSSVTQPGGPVVVESINYPCGWTAVGMATPAFSDNCPDPILSYHLVGFFAGSADGIGTINGVTFLEGTTTVTYTVTDAVGNTVSCSITVTVNCLTISGRIIWEHDVVSGVKNATVNAANVLPTPPFTGSDLSDAAGDYEISVPVAGTYKLTPVKNTGGNVGRMNGVDALDATRITNHVNFSNPITDPYKKVCADVNRSGIINTQDATLITQCIMGNPTAQAVFNVFWRFTPTDYPMPGTAHQNVPAFPAFKDVPVVALDVLGVNFFGMKIGDVAAAWADPQAAPIIPPLVWVLQDQTLVAGTEVELTFAASNFNDLAAYQFALDFDPTQLQFVGFQPLDAISMNLLDNFGSYNADLGELRNAWAAGTGTTLADGTPVFRAKFKVLASGQKLSQVLKLDDSEISCKAYSEAYVPTDVKLLFTESVGSDTPLDLGNLQLQLLQNRPNPFTDATTIGFILPEACEAHIRILDISGRELTSYDRKYTAGYHELEFRMENAWSYGMLFCELVTPQGKRTIKMMTAK